MGPPHISVVSPVYKAEGCVRELYRRIVATMEGMGFAFEVILVEDCGGDRSWGIIQERAAADPRLRGFHLSRNFGQHYAITCGLDHARGDWVVILDCDLQDQPEEIPRLYAEAQKGFDVVLARRMMRQDRLLKRLSSAAFYTSFNYLTGVQFDKEVAGFCILSRKVVDSITAMREADRFLMGFVQWVGFRTSKVDVTHAPRYSGETSYNLRRLLRHAWNTSIGFSNKPLHWAIKIGFWLSAVSLAVAVLFAYLAWRSNTVPPGWASLAVSIYFLSGLIIANLGIVAIYLGKVFQQAKQRPLYIVREATDGGQAAPGGAGPGQVFWITGLAGSGKSTIGRLVHGLLKGRGRACVYLDGDAFREAMGNDLGYDVAGRLANARRISRACRLVSDQGLDVVCATQSLFRECHVWNRANIPNYHEVYLKVKPETLRARDQKGLWSQGEGVVGVDQLFEEPERPDLVIRSEAGGDTPEVAAARVVGLVWGEGLGWRRTP